MTELNVVAESETVFGCIGIKNTLKKTLPCSVSQIKQLNSNFIILNEQMRLCWDKKQWIIQVRSGGRFRNKSFCATKIGLLSVLKIVTMPPEIQDLILSFPASIHDWHLSLTSSPL